MDRDQRDILDLLAIGDNTFIATDTTLPNPERLLAHNHGQVRELPLEPVMPIGSLLGSPHYEVLRQAHIKPFRPSSVNKFAGLVRQLANARLDELLPKKRFDLTQEYGGVVAASMVCHLLDMPLERAREVLDNVNQLSLTDPEAGGNDIANGGDDNDFILTGNALTAADQIDGGAGTDTVYMTGGKSMTFGATTMVNVENLNLTGGSYALITNDATVGAGQTLTIADRSRGIIWAGGRARDVGTLAGGESSVVAINNSGQVVGDATVPDDDHQSSDTRAILFEAGTLQPTQAVPAHRDPLREAGRELPGDGHHRAILLWL